LASVRVHCIAFVLAGLFCFFCHDCIPLVLRRLTPLL
jgi:hypothetical protein